MDEKVAYLDNAATTRVCDAAADAAMRMMRVCYGNPSSLHALGAASAREMNAAREIVAAMLGCERECICFTAGGSEANNLAIFGAANAKIRAGRKLVTTAAEHSSVAGAMKRLSETGWEVAYITPDAQGNIDAQAVADAVDGETTLVSMMLVNNETGAIFPVKQAAELIRAKNPQTLIHCDAVQAFGKLSLKPSRLDVDLLSVSGHKIGAPKGVGALYLRRGVRILPLVYGGGQERGLRAGTENLPMIAAMGAACGLLHGHVEENLRRAAALRLSLLEKLREIPQVCINSTENASPYIMNLSVAGYRSETMLHFLESRGVYVSSGSACSKGAASPVLTAMGLSPALIDSALRVSLIYDTTEEELARLAAALAAGIATIAHR